MLQQDSNKMFPYDYINLTLKQKFILPQLFVAGLLAIAIYELKNLFLFISLFVAGLLAIAIYELQKFSHFCQLLTNSPQTLTNILKIFYHGV